MGDGTGRGLVHALATTQVWEPYFQIVRWRERHGEYTLEHDDEYVLAMVNALGGGLDASILCDALSADDELRESTFWRIFEVPGSERVNLAYLDRHRGTAGQGWQTSIERLVADGTLDRDRVLHACAGALRLQLPTAQHQWFDRLRRSLVPARRRTP